MNKIKRVSVIIRILAIISLAAGIILFALALTGTIANIAGSIALIGGCIALLLRSLCPPFSLPRAISAFFGGILAGVLFNLAVVENLNDVFIVLPFAFLPALLLLAGFADIKIFRWSLVIIVVVVFVFYGIIAINEEKKETAFYRSIVNDVLSQIDINQSRNNNTRLSGRTITLLGSAIIWDIENDSLSPAQNSLPISIKAAVRDSPITIFFVVDKKFEKIGHFSVSGQPAYRVRADILVVYWPKTRVVVYHSVISREGPPNWRAKIESPWYGDPKEEIVEWIESLKIQQKQ